ncbi:MAG TPA: carboxypeptidase-like regulatory domain-containing protein, partial [Bryobacteraceae bacterium]|nr:carboxypeptidase-like regulatory domain-containing protein [Bryobacteraceae bacterium]
GAQKYQTQTDDAGVYNFTDLPAGEYTLKVAMAGFKSRTVKSIRLSEGEPNRLLDIPLDVAAMACGRPIILDRILLPPGSTFGSLAGSVSPAVAGVEVTLVCRTFTPCRSTKTDSRGEFTFDMLSSGIYGMNFRREGFYPENATGYDYTVHAGWESVYSFVGLQRCLNSGCDPKLRPPRPIIVCE